MGMTLKVVPLYIHRVEITVCLYVRIRTEEPLDRFVSTFDFKELGRTKRMFLA